jgi:hypothetical protein
MRIIVFVSLALIALHSVGMAEWSFETVQNPRTGRGITRAKLPEFGGRATLIIRCSQQYAEPVVYLHRPAKGTHLPLIYRFDDDGAQNRLGSLSDSGHVLRIWDDVEKEAFAHAKRLRIQLRPFVVFDFDLRGIETIAAKIRC